MTAFKVFVEEHAKLQSEFAGTPKPSSALVARIRDFIRRIGEQQTANNEVIAAHPAHPRAKDLGDENRELRKIRDFWLARVA